MKHDFNRVLSIVALLMLSLSIWARDGQVTINVLPNANAGTVTSAISDGVCTLTVTPAQGYYLTAGNLRAVATLNGGNVQAPKRTIPINEGALEITATNPDADPMGVTTYTFNIEEAYNVEVTATFQANPNPLSVCGVVVTEQNCDNVLGENTPTVAYDYATNTLTLNNATLDPEGNDWAIVVGSELSVLNVKILGTNFIRCNAIKFFNPRPSMVFATDPITPGSLLVGPFNEASVPYSLISPEIGDNASSVFYENTLKLTSSADNLLIDGDEPIMLKISDVSVTEQNMGDILGNKTVSFDAATKTLTLNGATIDMPKAGGCPIQSNIQNLKVCLIGENTLATTDFAGFMLTNAATAGTLTFVHADNGYGRLTVTGGAIAQGYNVAYDTQESGWSLAEGSVSYLKTYGLTIGNTVFTAINLTVASENGTATFNPLNNTLSLNNFTSTDNLTSTLPELIISLTGANSLGTINGQIANDAIVIRKDMNSEAVVNKLTATAVSDFTTVTVDDPLTEKTVGGQTVISDVISYNLWVNGVQVDKENMSAVTNGISFDGDHTLTLNNVNATSNETSFITNGLANLTIHLLGTNTVNCEQFLAKKEDDNDHQVTFSTNMNAAGKLTVNVSNVDEWMTGHTPTYLNGLTTVSSESAMTIEAPTENYALAIGDVAVTNLNAADVLGDGKVSFDASKNTLTLKAASITGNIASSREVLNIYLVGNNTMSGNFTLGEGRTSAELVFASEGNADDKLTMGAAFATGLTVRYSNKLQLDGLVIALPVNYGISVAATGITSTNRRNVLNDEGTVRFNNNNQLVLENATINGEIVVEDAASLPENTLVLYLLGNNTINLSEGQNAVKCSNGTLNLEFMMDDNQRGTLDICGPTDYMTESNIFPNSVTVDLSSFNHPIAEGRMSIAALLQPVVSDSNPTAEVDYSNMPASTSTNNTVIDGVLYTTGNETNDKENSSGIDNTTGNLVLSEGAAMTPEQVKNISSLPGSAEYAKVFPGITFKLPAGLSTIQFKKVVCAPLYVFKFTNGKWTKELGQGDPIVVVTSSHSQTIQVYLSKKTDSDPGAPQMADRRIGPKSSVAGGLGGISIKSNSVQNPTGPSDNFKLMELSVLSAAISALSDAHSGFIFDDPDITNLPDNMFILATAAPELSSAPRRAPKTILPDDLTFIDFSKTKITGMEVSRKEGPFNGVPENVFIYMPAGNTTKEKNVVIGGICDMMELDGSDAAMPFKAMKDFTVGQATLKREFAAGSEDSKATIYLPFAVSQEDADQMGTFYQFDSFDGDVVNMTKVTTGGLKANKPYIFAAKAGGVVNPQVNLASVIAGSADTEGFKGVFERKDYESGMYCYAAEARDGKNTIGQFVEMGPGSYVPPFRAYIVGNGAPSLAIAWDGVIDNTQNNENLTAVESVKKATVRVQEGWWTLNGVHMKAQPKKAGLYIHNGKMVVVK